MTLFAPHVFKRYLTHTEIPSSPAAKRIDWAPGRAVDVDVDQLRRWFQEVRFTRTGPVHKKLWTGPVRIPV